MRGLSRSRFKLMRVAVSIVIVAALLPTVGAGVAGGSAEGPRPDSVYGRTAEAGAAGVKGLVKEAKPSRVMVQWRPGVPQSQIDAAAAQVGFRVARTSERLGWTLLEPARTGMTVERLVESLRSSRLTKRVEVERLYRPQTLTTPNDPLFDRLWGLHNTGQTGGTEDADIDAPEAWTEFGTGSKDVVVAVIDTGVDHAHADLRPNRWINRGEIPNNGVDDDGNGFVDDYYGYDFYNYDSSPFDPADGDQHGTHVAGTIGAKGDNGIGVAGVNWDVTIMPVKFLGPEGGWDFDGAEAIVYAVDNGADIINASWGGGYSEILEDAIQYAADHGVIFVAAAGNWGEDVDVWGEWNYPASSECTNVVTVAATDHDDELTWWSNYGANTVEVAAPGEDILSTLPYETCALYINSPPYRISYLAMAAEAVEPVSTRDALITRATAQVGATLSTPVLVVDDSMPGVTDETPGERLAVYTDALAAAGYTNVTTWDTESQGTPAFTTLRNKVVIWFTGATAWGWYDEPTLNDDERAVLSTYLDNGGRLVMASGELATDMQYFGWDGEWFENYFHATVIDFTAWGYEFAGVAGTPFAGLAGSIPEPYQVWYEPPWPTGVDIVMPIDSVAKPMVRIGGYGELSGTSMAAPHVTGALAKLMQSFPDASAEELIARISNTVDPHESLERTTVYGGRINLDAAHRAYPGKPGVTAPVSGEILYGGGDYDVTWTTASGADPGATFEVEWSAPDVVQTIDFETADLSGFELTGETMWEITDETAYVHSGDYAVRSGSVPKDVWSYGSITTTVTAPAGGGMLSFWGMLDTSEYDSVGALFVNGSAVWYSFESVPWSLIEADLRPGENRVEWFFDTYQFSEQDNVFAIDDVTVYGFEYDPIGTVGAGESQITWTVPEIDTDLARVRVRAHLDEVASAWDTVRGVRITTDTEAPEIPSAFTALAGNDGDATLTWNDPPDADFELTRVVRSTTGEPTGPNDPDAEVIYEGTAEEFYDFGLSDGETYHYAAFARDRMYNWSDGAHDSIVAFDEIGPEAPAFFDAFMWEGTVALTWTPPAPGTYAGVTVLRRLDAPPTGPDDPLATLVFDGVGAWAADWDLSSDPFEGHAYYGAWAYDASFNWSDGAFVDLGVDTSGPEGTFVLNGDEEHTADPVVEGNADVMDAVEMRFHVNGEYDPDAEWVPYAPASEITLQDTDGWQSVTAEFRDDATNVLEITDDIYVNLRAPYAPTGLNAASWGSRIKLNWEDPRDGGGDDWDDWDDWYDCTLSPRIAWDEDGDVFDPRPTGDFDVVGWNVFMALAEEGPYELLNDELVPWPEYMASDLTAGQTYWFKVQAVDIVGHEGALSEAVSETAGEGVVRRAGSGRYETATEVSAAHWKTADTVIVATGVGYADALGAASLAGCYDAPVLLTRPNTVPAALSAEIARLDATRVIIVGGEAAVGPLVEQTLAASYDVDRIEGRNRYDTAAQVALEVAALQGEEYAGEAFIVSGRSFADALAISPFAYSQRIPILLVTRDSAPVETVDAIDAMGVHMGYVVGGEGVVSEWVPDLLGLHMYDRIEGGNRYDTSAMAAEYGAMMGWGDFGFVGVATGASFADALAGGPAVGRNGGVMVLTRPAFVPDSVFETLYFNAESIRRIEIFGGETAVSAEVHQMLKGFIE